MFMLIKTNLRHNSEIVVNYTKIFFFLFCIT